MEVRTPVKRFFHPIWVRALVVLVFVFVVVPILFQVVVVADNHLFGETTVSPGLVTPEAASATPTP